MCVQISAYLHVSYGEDIYDEEELSAVLGSKRLQVGPPLEFTPLLLSFDPDQNPPSLNHTVTINRIQNLHVTAN